MPYRHDPGPGRSRSPLVAVFIAVALLLAVSLVVLTCGSGDADAHVTSKQVRKAKRAVRQYVAATRPGAQSIGLGVDVRDPLNHAIVLSGSFIRPDGRRCVIRQATLRHARLLTYSDCMGGIG
jgi:hypothetical protein